MDRRTNKITEKTNKIINSEDILMSSTTRVPYFPLVVDRGKGSYIYDIEGNKFIDFLSSAAVTNLGHAHPEIVKAINEQAGKFIHYTPAYAYHKPHYELASLLVDITPGDFKKRVSFGLSGSDSVDGALKAAKVYTGRDKIISFKGSYHGTTYGALSVSGYSSSMRNKMGSLLNDVYFAHYPDYYRTNLTNDEEDEKSLKSIEEIFNYIASPDEIAAIIFEPIQGDAGILVPSKNFIKNIQSIANKYGILLIVDEVQTGFGRTGKLFASELFDLEPDLLVLGKAIASGMPLSAIVGRKEILESWQTPMHFFNTAGNVISCAAALKNIEIINQNKFLLEVQEKGKYLKSKLENLIDKYDIVGDVRGEGLLLGVDIVEDKKTKNKAKVFTSKICWRAWELGLILAFFSDSVLRIAPPLTINKKEIDLALQIIDQSIYDVVNNNVKDDVLEFIKGW